MRQRQGAPPLFTRPCLYVLLGVKCCGSRGLSVIMGLITVIQASTWWASGSLKPPHRKKNTSLIVCEINAGIKFKPFNIISLDGSCSFHTWGYDHIMLSSGRDFKKCSHLPGSKLASSLFKHQQKVIRLHVSLTSFFFFKKKMMHPVAGLRY